MVLSCEHPHVPVGMRSGRNPVSLLQAGVSLVGLPQSAGMLGRSRWTSFPRGHRKRGRGRQGKEGPGRKRERKRERESAGRRGNERILFFLYLSFPCYLPYDFLIHQNAGKIMFWAK